MGTWLGHAAPGTFFIGLGIWWTIRTFQEFYSKQEAYKSTLTKRCQPCGKGQKLNIETVIIILLACMGIGAEIITGVRGQHWPQGNTQHATMYFAFGLTGVVDLLRCFNVKFIPPGGEYIMYILALSVELLLFRFHLHGREEVDKHIHMLLVYTIAANVVAVVLEFAYRTNKHAAIARIFFTLVQGTWFVQIAFTLYSPMKGGGPILKLDAIENIMIITTIYAWHLLGVALGMLICGAFIQWCCGSSNNSRPFDEDHLQLLSANNNGETTSFSKHYRDYTTDDETVEWSSQKLQATNITSQTDQ